MKKLVCLGLSILLTALSLRGLPAAGAAGPDAAELPAVVSPAEADAPDANGTPAVPAAAAITVPTVSDNAGAHDYTLYSARPVRSTLIANGDGSLTRVENVDSRLICEIYNADGSFRSGKELSMELPLYGGVCVGTSYNFAVFGKTNEAESNYAEVIRVVRYDKSWNRLDSVSLKGANTVEPFRAGSLRMVQAGDMLYILSCHSMYRYIDGVRHQANLTLAVHIPTMKITDSRYAISNMSTGYVSHSFNQFILTNGNDLLTLDHWEAASIGRGAIVHCYKNAAGSKTLPSSAAFVNAFPFAAGSGNLCGADLGGFAAMDGGKYLVVGCSVPLDATDLYAQRNIFVSVVKAANLFFASQTQTLWLTDHAAGSGVSVSNPQTLKLSGDRLLVLWTENNVLRWTCVNSSGFRLCPVYSANGAKLSDCQPILVNGSIVWYVTDGCMPVFYRINSSDLSQLTAVDSGEVTPTPGLPFTDVPVGAWYSKPVAWAVAHGVSAGTSPTTFSPSLSCSRAQFVTFLWRAAGSPAPGSSASSFVDVPDDAYYAESARWAAENGYVSGIGDNCFGPDLECSRAQVVTILWRCSGSPTVWSYNPFKDLSSTHYCYWAVLWAYYNGVTGGTSSTTFSPDLTCSRAQTVTFLYKLFAD